MSLAPGFICFVVLDSIEIFLHKCYYPRAKILGLPWVEEEVRCAKASTLLGSRRLLESWCQMEAPREGALPWSSRGAAGAWG